MRQSRDAQARQGTPAARRSSSPSPACPDGRRVVFGGSDFKVYDVDLAADKPEPKELDGHDSYVTGVALAGRQALVSGGYDGKLIWWDTREPGAGPRRRGPREVDPQRGRVAATASSSPASPTTWSAGSGTPRPASCVHELRGHEEQTPHHFPSMLYACAFSPDGKHLATGDKVGHVVVWDVATGRQAVARWRRRACTPGTRGSGATRSAASAPWPSRRTATQLAVGGIGKIGNIDHLEARPASRSSTGGTRNGPSIPRRVDQGPGRAPRVPPGRRLAPGGRRGERRLPHAPRPEDQGRHAPGEGPGARPRRRARRHARPGLLGRARAGSWPTSLA